jgi:proteasome accessory factor C
MAGAKVRDEGRLERLISLAYLLSTRTEIHIEELSERLGVSRSTIEDDLNVLMFCGLPPYSPEQLFDIMIDDDFVSMYFNEVFIKPLRLTREEKARVVIALTRLSQQVEDSEKRAIADVLKIIDDSHTVNVELRNGQFDDIMNKAIESGSNVEIEYLSLNSADITRRIIRPLRVLTTASISYVYAYCFSVEDFRMFRSDRVLFAELNNEDLGGIPESQADEIEEAFISGTETYVDLYVDPQASYVLDSYPHEQLSSNVYRFPTRSPYFVARMLLMNQPYVRYEQGSFDRAAILEALHAIENRYQELENIS